MKEKILAVPSNIITGFLGVGKTSAIMHLLKQKPQHERWAVLVNEFGEIGVDGSLFNTSGAQSNNIFIEEVSGGCMCCASGVPMQIALNRLLTKAKPHRLLIEPTGLGHPYEVLQLLSNQYYRDVLNIENTITLVDARNLADSRYTQHHIFNQQIDIADVIVGNKSDLYNEQDKEKLQDYLANKHNKKPKLYFSEHGKISLTWLSGVTKQNATTDPSIHKHSHHTYGLNNKTAQKLPANISPFPTSGIIRADNQGEGFKSVGWRFSPTLVFNKQAILSLLNNLDVTRIKAVLMTNEGVISYNKASEALAEILVTKKSKNDESRIEIIYHESKSELDDADDINEQWQKLLIAAINN